MKTAFVLSLLICSCFVLCARQTHPFVFQHLKQEQGLSNNVVTCILKDRTGFMWFGTDNGLNRYDGNSFLIYRHESKNPQSLPDNRITSLFEDSKGQIWVGTANGLAVFQPLTGKFISYIHTNRSESINPGYVAQVFEDSQSQIWICLFGGGLDLFDAANKRFLHHTWSSNDPFAIAGNNAKAILELENGKYLVGTFEAGDGVQDIKPLGHINIYDAHTNRFSALAVTGIQLPKNYRQNIHQLERLVHTIFRDSHGRIWFGTYCGILCFTPQSHTWQCFENDATDPFSLSHNTIRAICEVNGKMYFGTGGGGLSVLDEKDHHFIHYRSDVENPFSISDDYIRALYNDEQDRLWIATEGGGINVVDLRERKFRLYPNEVLRIPVVGNRTEKATIFSVCPCKQGKVLLGSGAGLSVLDTRTETSDLYNKLSAPLKGTSSVHAILANDDGSFYVSFNERLLKCSFSENGKLKVADARFESPYFSEVPILNITRHSNAALFIDFLANASQYYYPASHGIKSANGIRAVLTVKDKSGTLWCQPFRVGADTRGGVISMDTNNQTYRWQHNPEHANSISSNKVQCIYCDKHNNVWVATDKGLDQINSNRKTITHIRGFANLPDTLINAMSEDESGNLWLATQYSLVRYHPQESTATLFLAGKDIPAHKLEDKLVYDRTEKAMYLTSNEGLIRFFPKELEVKKDSSSVLLTNVYVFNKIFAGDTAATFKRQYHFRHNENFITIDFIAPDFGNAPDRQYAYKLEGLNKEWVDVGAAHQANFSNLQPGNYIFSARSRSSSSDWTYSKPISLMIGKPWWQTAGFYFLCMAIVIAIIAGYNSYRTNIFKKQTALLESRVNERTSQYREQKERAEKNEQYRSQFLANMSHEIRTPIHAIRGMTRLLINNEKEPGNLKWLNNIQHASELLLHTVNDILDISKIEAGKINLEQIAFSFEEITGRLYEMFAPEAASKKLEFFVETPTLPRLMGDPFRLQQLLTNLCSNAVKFTEKGTVRVNTQAISETEEQMVLRIVVEDTGIGIAPEHINSIFDQFMQANTSDTRRFGGTGLGLAIAKNIVMQMQGAIHVESTEGVGTKFCCTLPFAIAVGETLQHTDDSKEISIPPDLNILLAEDNHYNQLLVQDALRECQYHQLDIAENGTQALLLLNSEQYDVVLMDVQMPGESGIEVARKYRALGHSSPIIALTAGVLPDEQQKCLDAGMNLVISKPFEKETLLHAINSVLSDQYKNKANSSRNNDHRSRIDLSRLQKFCDGDTDRIDRYILLYTDAVPLFLADMQKELTQRNSAAVATLIHAFKPKWKMMGMEKALGLALQIEQHIASGKLPDALARELLLETELSLSYLPVNLRR